jgi:acetolactate synthase-1/2/3 large subunit
MKVWLITGCATGFGAQLAQAVLNRGDAVVATDVYLAPLDHLRSPHASQLLAAAMDVTDDQQIRAVVAQTIERFGRIDVLVNNAGLGMGGPFEEVDLAAARKLLDVNLIGTMVVTHAALPYMRQRGSGHIVCLSSDSGVVGFPFQNVYTASKFGVEGLMECLAHEVYPFGIHITLIEPCGTFKTTMPREAVAQAKAAIRQDSPYYQRVMSIAAGFERNWEAATEPVEVVKAILDVVDMPRPPLRRRVGTHERTELLSLRRTLPDAEFIALIRTATATGHERVQKQRGQANGGDLIVRTLKQEGVDRLFCIVGGHNYEIVNACIDAGIHVVDTRHEQAAAHMADAYARFTRAPGVVTVDGAPGLVNAFPGVQVAHESQVPMLVLTAQGSLAGRDIGVMQAIDQLRVMRSVTKWQRTCYDTKRLPEYTAAALRYALSGRPMPVFLDFPLEVLRANVSFGEAPEPHNYRTTALAYGDPTNVRQALDLLSSAKKPMILVGSGVWWGRAEEELRAFAEQTGIPVLARNLGRGIVPDDSPLGCGMMPYPANLADAFLVIGARLDWTIGYGRFPLFPMHAPVIQIDVVPEVIGKTRAIDVGIWGDAKAVLSQMIDAARDYTFDVSREWQMTAHGALPNIREEAFRKQKIDERDPSVPMHSLQLVRAYKRWADGRRDAITIVDGGYIAAFALEHLDCNTPGSVLWVGSTGHLGVGVPFANAAKLAHPARPVVALMGDGSFGLCAMEFDTAVRHNLPIIVVVANDEGWGEIRDGQRKRYGDTGVIASDFGIRRYDQMAVALGGYGEWVERPEEIGPALERAMRSGKPAFINVHTDPNQRSGIVSGLPWIIE